LPVDDVVNSALASSIPAKNPITQEAVIHDEGIRATIMSKWYREEMFQHPVLVTVLVQEKINIGTISDPSLESA